MSFTTGLTMTDDALVTFGQPTSGGVMFHDTGFMPVTAESVAGHTFAPPAGTTMFLAYNATGVQHFSASGAPTTADYTQLHYTLYAAQGKGSFGHAADGTPTSAGMSDLVKLAGGYLIKGELAFTQTGGITGSISATASVFGAPIGSVAMSIQHAATDIGHTATGGLTLSGGNPHATFG